MKNYTYSALAAVALFALASSAYAAEVPTISLTTLNTSNATTTSAAIGTAIHARVQLATASTTLSRPAGTVDVSVYPNTTCAGTASVQSGLALVDGGVMSTASNTPATGLSFKARYNGQGDVFTVVDSSCVPVTAVANSVTIAHALSSTSVATGTAVRVLASLSGTTANAGGTVAYNVYSNNSCSTLYTSAGSRTVTNASTTFSNDVAFSTSGTYYWQSVYSGDTSNSSATTACSPLTVTSTNVGGTPTATTTPAGTGTINGIVYNDVNKTRVRDAGEAGIAGVKINLFKGNGWWKRWGGPIATVTSDANGQYSFTGLADGTYSIEEVVPTGWKQISSDFRAVVLANGIGVGGKDFANVEKSPKPKPRQDKIEKWEKKIEKIEKKIEKHKSNSGSNSGRNGHDD